MRKHQIKNVLSQIHQLAKNFAYRIEMSWWMFALALFLTEQRKKEVGIRKVLGCSVPGIINLFSKEYILLLLIANAIAWPVAYWVINQALLSTYKVNWSLWTFIVPGIFVLLLALITVGSRSLRTAVANPVEALRYE